MLRELLAPNPSPMTLDGTRTYLVGERRVAIIDPGPAGGGHFDAIVDAVGDGRAAAILLTHGHPDHAAGAAELAERLDAPVHDMLHDNLPEGARTGTDAGDIVAVPTPGHTPDHVSFHWPSAGAVFCGDLLMGGLETALVAFPEGDLGEYLRSLERLRSLRPRVLYPAHGPRFDDPDRAIDAYIRHRHEREAQVLAALDGGAADVEAIAGAVYGDAIHRELRAVAVAAVRAYLEHLAGQGLVRQTPAGGWRRVD